MVNFAVNFFTFTFTLPSKHQKRHNIFQTTLSHNIQMPENSLTNFPVPKRTITTSSLLHFLTFTPNQIAPNLQKRTLKLVVSKWSYHTFQKRSKRSLSFSRSNKIHSPSPHKEANLKQMGDSNILSSFVIRFLSVVIFLKSIRILLHIFLT